MDTNKYDLEDRLVRFAGEVIIFTKTLPFDKAGKTLEDQMTRSSISAALNYGEAQGTETDKDFVHKMSIVLKELKETRVAFKITLYVKFGDQEKLNLLFIECEELIRICASRIKNRKKQMELS
jgi:four helix bundle protein